MTKEEARLTLQENFGYLSEEHPRIIEAMKVAMNALSKPPLPSNLDEAAEKYELSIGSQDYCFLDIEDAFKAGAEWRAGQMKQEQPEKSTKKNCNNCPHCIDRKDQYGWHFKGCFGGPYKGKFIAEIDECPIEQEQPEVDLDREIAHIWGKCAAEPKDQIACLHIESFIEIARHFYELGKNSK